MSILSLDSVKNGAGGRICRSKRPSIADSIVSAKWSGLSAGNVEKDLIFDHANKIAQ